MLKFILKSSGVLGLLFILVYLTSQPIQAAEYFVSPTGSTSNNGSQQSPWTIDHAAAQAQPGDVITLRSGTYLPGQDGVGLRPSRSGTSSNPITYRAFNGETPILQGGGVNLDLSDRSYIIVDGLTLRDPQNRWASLANADRNIVRNSRFTFTTDSTGLATGWTGFEIGQDNDSAGTYASSYNRVTGNTFERWGIWHPYENGGPALAVYSNGSSFNVIENNQFYGASHSDVRITTRRNVVRNNRFSNDQQKNLELGGNTGEFGVAGSTLVEGNDFGAAEFNREEHGGMHIHIYSEDNIIRRNTFHDAAAYSIDIFVEPGTGESARNNAQHGATRNAIVHNTFANNSVKHFNRNNQQYQVHCPPVICIIRFSDQNSPLSNNVMKNNIMHDNKRSQVGEAQADVNLMAGGPWGAHIYAGNLINNMTMDPNAVVLQVTGLPLAPLSTMQANYSANVFGNITGQDPRFVTYNPGNLTNLTDGQYDFRLQSNSPAIDRGVALTTTTTSGSGTTVTVADARYFHDGFSGMIPPDEITIGTQQVNVTGVNYSNNQLTIDRSISWTANAPVNLRFAGNAPDIGAFESGVTGPASPAPTISPSPAVSPSPSPNLSCQTADINQDGSVNAADRVLQLTDFFRSTLNNPRTDINADGRVNLFDYALLVRSFGQSCS